MKVYIIQNHDGMSYDEAWKAREKIWQHYQKRGGEVIENIIVTKDTDVNLSYPELMVNSRILSLMSDADLAVYMENWDKSERCLYENSMAIRYSIPQLFWVDGKPVNVESHA